MINTGKILIPIICTCTTFSIGYVYGVCMKKKKEYEQKISYLKKILTEKNKDFSLLQEETDNIVNDLHHQNKTLKTKYTSLVEKYNSLQYDFNDITEKLFKSSIEHENEINRLKEYYINNNGVHNEYETPKEEEEQNSS